MEDKDSEYETFIVELNLEDDEFLDYVVIEMAKKGIGVDKEAITTLMEIVDNYIITKIEGECFGEDSSSK